MIPSIHSNYFSDISYQQIMVAILHCQKTVIPLSYLFPPNLETHMCTNSLADMADTHVTLPGQPPSLITSYEQLAWLPLHKKRGCAGSDSVSLVLSFSVLASFLIISQNFWTLRAKLFINFDKDGCGRSPIQKAYSSFSPVSPLMTCTWPVWRVTSDSYPWNRNVSAFSE